MNLNWSEREEQHITRHQERDLIDTEPDKEISL
jgi:hypothetical protein